MSARLCYGVPAVALLVTAGAAAAAPGGSTMKAAKDALSLTPAQRHEIYRDVRSQKLSEAAPRGFTAKVGETVPNSVTLHPLPASVVKQAPVVKSDDYAVLRRQVLIVDPKSNKIADVIAERR